MDVQATNRSKSIDLASPIESKKQLTNWYGMLAGTDTFMIKFYTIIMKRERGEEGKSMIEKYGQDLMPNI